MNLNDYQTAALRTAKMFPTMAENMAHAALGVITEVGEFTTEVKRHTIYSKPLDDQMSGHMIEELGDLMWYIALGTHSVGLTLQGAYDMDDDKHPATGNETFAQLSFGLSMVSMVIAGVALACEADEDDVRKDIREIAVMFSATMQIIDSIANRLGVTIGELMERNIAKLRLRFPEKYSDDAAEARADKNGLDARAS